jgi:peptide/nickel transport system substrate-binding protein
LAHYGTSIVSQRAVTEHGNLFHENPTGSGPFKFDSITLGDRVELSRFEEYWGDKPVFSKLTWRAMPEATNRLIEVEAGNADIALHINPSDIARAESSSSLVLHRKLGVGAHYLGLNVLKAPFDDIRVRQAIAHALDLETISNVCYEGSGSFGASAIPSVIWGGVTIEPFGYDVERAKQLMAEAGLADGFSTSLWYNTEDQQYAQAVQMIQNQLREINIDVTITAYEWATYLDLTEVGEHEMFLLSWYTPTGDADYGLYDTSSTMGWGAGNRSFFSNPDIDALLIEGRSSVDPARRLAIYADAQELIRDEAGNIHFHYTEELHVTTPNVRGLVLNPNGQHDMWRITFGN